MVIWSRLTRGDVPGGREVRRDDAGARALQPPLLAIGAVVRQRLPALERVGRDVFDVGILEQAARLLLRVLPRHRVARREHVGAQRRRAQLPVAHAATLCNLRHLVQRRLRRLGRTGRGARLDDQAEHRPVVGRERRRRERGEQRQGRPHMTSIHRRSQG
jgi:hypothetical protein